MKDFYSFTSSDGTLIKGQSWKIDEKKVKKVIYISHGMAEHIERYDHFANFMNFNGFVVYGHDHRGHGRSSKSMDDLGKFYKDDWQVMREDLHKGIAIAKYDYPHSEIVLLGHSMGSFLVRDYLLHYSDVDEIILSGTGYLNRSEINLGRFISSIICKASDPQKPSKLLDKLSFGLYNRKVSGPMTSFDWLSTDHDQVSKYINDPYCGNIHSAMFYSEFLGALNEILYQSKNVEIGEKTKILIISGSDDPVGNYAKGVKKTYKYYSSRLDEVEMILYPKGRHEILNEVMKDEVYNDVANWLLKSELSQGDVNYNA